MSAFDKMRIDSGLVRQLAELLDQTGLSEIEIQNGEHRIRVGRAISVSTAGLTVAAAAPTLAPMAAPADHAGMVKSPMVGTTYLAPQPGAVGFVTVGKQIAAGDTLLIIEAMKVMNPIVAPRAGKILQVLVEDGQPVEFDQPLVIIE